MVLWHSTDGYPSPIVANHCALVIRNSSFFDARLFIVVTVVLVWNKHCTPDSSRNANFRFVSSLILTTSRLPARQRQ